MSGFGPPPDSSASQGIATDVRRRARLDTGRLGAFRVPPAPGPGVPGTPGAASGSSTAAPATGPPRGKNAASLRAAAAAAAAYQDALDKAAENTARTVDGHIETLVEGMGALVQSASVGDKAEHLVQEDNLVMVARADAMVRAANSLVSLSRGLSVSLCLAQFPTPASSAASSAAPEPPPSATTTPAPSSGGVDVSRSSTPVPSAPATPGASTSTPTGAPRSSDSGPAPPVGQRHQAQLNERVALLSLLLSARREAARYIDALARAAGRPTEPPRWPPSAPADAGPSAPVPPAGNDAPVLNPDAMDLDPTTTAQDQDGEVAENGERDDNDEGDLWGEDS